MFDQLPKWIISIILIFPLCIFIGNTTLFILGYHISKGTFISTVICGVGSIASYHIAKDIFFKK